MAKKKEAAPPAVVPAPQVPAAPATNAGAGFVGFDQEDLVIPRLRIAQPTNRQDWTPGKFYESLSDESFESLEGVVALRLNKSRVYFIDDGGGHPACASDDNVRPSPRIENPIAPFCQACPNAQWQDRTPPLCSETWNFLLVHQGMPYYIGFSGAALSNTRKLVTALFLRAKQQGKPLWGFQFDIGLKKQEFKQGIAYMPTFTNVKLVDDVANYDAMAQTFTAPAAKVDGGTDFLFGENANAGEA